MSIRNIKKVFSISARKFKSHIVVLILCCCAAAAGGWAAKAVLQPAPDVNEPTQFTYVEAVSGTVGSTIDVTTLASWVATPVAANRASGVVTEVFVQSQAGDVLGQGSNLYSVNLRPVAIAVGAVPSFRDLQVGDTGGDVGQLEQMLKDRDLFNGAADGRFDDGLTEAVKRWQSSQGIDATGVVRGEDVVFVPALPARIALDTGVIAPGLNVVGGEKAISAFAAQPSFTVRASPAQASLMKPGAVIEIRAPKDGLVWTGVVPASGASSDGQGVNFELSGGAEKTICGLDCSIVPPEGRELPSKLVVVEPTTGLTLPTAAILSQPNGELEVIDREGVHHKVRITMSALGMSIIDGIDPGTSVRVPARSRQGAP
ncbi:peptidoglycan-binding protein [Paenarthrobacter sp. A20]|uniref:peptidoglycan-binding domain-containing protein n=1 Tax=Paenarthrobacter sp. A20 TaxID=2817891 RepID=UPI0020A08E7E|nr:peptidoglycan-binding domain-containing protein [Paenarthrobacter sp. A20]MCP1412897.1 peptidoglycan hydrolase-like protein with peptidoglycan-binding domain [Paenarthrobacter sp. A20]